MTTHIQKLAVSVISMALSAGPSFAKKPDSPGNSGKNKTEQWHEDRLSSSNKRTSYQGFFNDDRRALIRNYYSQIRVSRKCPPGLAKKNNGCLPPGQAKKWRKGHPLPVDVVYYDLPTTLLHELGGTPDGQKIVRVGTDLLLISIGTGMVIDAFEDLDDVF
jgi:Ni/Co efflux regulator RcnB